jgi:hypothetical protein
LTSPFFPHLSLFHASSFVQEELLATHTDYREELTRLARQMSESKQRDASENESFSVKVRQS